MRFHIRRPGGETAAVIAPALPPVPDSTSADLRLLPPEVVHFRREQGELQMHRDAWPPEEAGAGEKQQAPRLEDGAGAHQTEEEKQSAGPPQVEDKQAESEQGSAPTASADAGAGQQGETEAAEADEDKEWRKVLLVRLFPLTEPERWISVVAEDGREVGIIEDLGKLNRQDGDLAREELERRYLVPQITAILSCRDRFDLTEWTVETDRGRITFTTRNARESAKSPLPGRLVLVDVEGNRFDIPDRDALDPLSRRLLDERV
ncbi:MAG: DUF1854 domain-containing protein [Armatimonadetes bacterium]|nr:DUF1854 domain-containing protein [Armatimonadota bacterium]